MPGMSIHRFAVRDDVDSERVLVSAQGTDVLFGTAVEADTLEPVEVYETDDDRLAADLDRFDVLVHGVVVEGEVYEPESPELAEAAQAAAVAEAEANAEQTAASVAERQAEVIEARTTESTPDGNAFGDTSQADADADTTETDDDGENA